MTPDASETTVSLGETSISQAEITLPEVLVEYSPRAELEIENPSRFVTLRDAGEFSDRSGSIPEILDSVAGVEITRYGGLGAFATVSIRGSSANQVAVFVDGIPLNGVGIGTVNLEDIPLVDVERVVVFRGQSPVGFGGGAMGGVVNIITRKTRQPRFSMKLVAGDYDTRDFNVAAAGGFGRDNRFSGYLDWETTSGDFGFKSDNGTPYNSDDDYYTTRKNNGHTSAAGGVKIENESSIGELTAALDLFSKNSGMPGLDYAQAENVSMTTKRGTLKTRFSPRIKQSAVLKNPEIKLDYTTQEERYSDKYDELGVGKNDVENSSWEAGAGLYAAFDCLDNAQYLRTSLDFRLESYRSHYMLPKPESYGPEQRRNKSTAGIEEEFLFLDGDLSVLPALRLSLIANSFNGDPYYPYPGSTAGNEKNYTLFSPSIGFAWLIIPAVKLKANTGEYQRAPEYYELFGDRGGIVGNGLLEPERSLNWDAGVAWKYDRGGFGGLKARFEAAYFRRMAENLILLVQNSQDTARAENISSADIRGVEFEAEADCADKLALRLAYLYQWARDTGGSFSDGKLLPAHPTNSINAKITVSPSESISFFTEWSHEDTAYWDRMNFVDVPERNIVNLGATGRIKYDEVDWTFTLEVRNLADAAVTDVARYPLPGRTWFVTMKAVY